MQCRARRRRKNQHLRPLPSSLDVSLLIWNHTIVETTQACCSIPSKSSSFVPLFHKFRYSYLRERESYCGVIWEIFYGNYDLECSSFSCCYEISFFWNCCCYCDGFFFTMQPRLDHFRTDSPTEPPSLSPTSPAEREKRPVTFLLWCHKFIDSGIWLLSGAPGKFGWMLRLLDPVRIVKLQNLKTKCHCKELHFS